MMSSSPTARTFRHRNADSVLSSPVLEAKWSRRSTCEESTVRRAWWQRWASDRSTTTRVRTGLRRCLDDR